MKKKLTYLLILVMVFLLLASCSKPKSGRIEENLFAFDTFMSFSVAEGRNAREGLKKAIDRIQQIEQRMSATLPDSDISRINENAGIQPVKVNTDTFFVIKKALEYAELSEGSFDISTLPISRLWDLPAGRPVIPDDEEIRQALAFVGYKKIKLDEEEQTVFLENKGMAIDLGGIAKGYAGDEVVRILKEHDVEHALINLGGNIMVINRKETGSPWRIGIQNPRKKNDADKNHIAVVQAEDCAIVTSGDYERYNVEIFKQTGERYHHIFDPETGYPAKNGVISVTIITEKGIDADALSTALFVMGAEKGLELANRLEGVEAMIVNEEKEIFLSGGLKGKVSDIHPDYSIVDR